MQVQTRRGKVAGVLQGAALQGETLGDWSRRGQRERLPGVRTSLGLYDAASKVPFSALQEWTFMIREWPGALHEGFWILSGL